MVSLIWNILAAPWPRRRLHYTNFFFFKTRVALTRLKWSYLSDSVSCFIWDCTNAVFLLGMVWFTDFSCICVLNWVLCLAANCSWQIFWFFHVLLLDAHVTFLTSEKYHALSCLQIYILFGQVGSCKSWGMIHKLMCFIRVCLFVCFSLATILDLNRLKVVCWWSLEVRYLVSVSHC